MIPSPDSLHTLSANDAGPFDTSLVWRLAQYTCTRRAWAAALMQPSMAGAGAGNDAAYVPTCSGEVSLRSAAITESAVMRPVFGFSDGMFSIPIVNEAESESTLI
jgi:hypothetical protein